MLRTPLIGLALCACTGSDLPTDEPVDCGRVEQDVDRLEFRDVLFGAPVTKSVRLSLPCASGEVGFDEPVLDGDDGFTAVLSSVDLAAGDVVQVDLTYDPEAGVHGNHAAALRLAYGFREVVVSLLAEVDPDQDGDGLDAEGAGGTDCDDFDAQVGAASPETDNGVDDDCDGFVDEDFVQAGDIVITELMLRPSAVRPEVGQWVEVLNRSERPVDLQNWTIEGEELAIVRGRTVARPGLPIVLAFSTSTEENGGVTAQGLLEGPTLAVRNPSLSLVLDEAVIAELTDGGTWPDPLGASIGVDPTRLGEASEAEADSWCAQESPWAEGSDSGTPGRSNLLCDHIDHDGDGFSVADGDCDDTDPSVGWRLPEVWDGKDNDCDTFVDDLFADTGSVGSVTGGLGSRFAGSLDLQVHDWSGDGVDDVVVLAGEFASEVLFLDGADLFGADEDPAHTLRDGWISAPRYGGVIPSEPGDVDADGDEDLVLFLSDSNGDDRLWVFEEAPRLGRSWDASDADLIVEETGTTLYPRHRHGSVSLDLDGDGEVETLYADTRDNSGVVMVLDLADQSGLVDLSDVRERTWTGAKDHGLGRFVSGGDTDGDGYDELFVTESDPRRVIGGIPIWRLSGASTLASSAAIDEVADLQLTGATDAVSVLSGRTRVADVDGDGRVDLLVGDPGSATLHVLQDIGSDTGTYTLSGAADLAITSPTGFTGADFDLLDFDADGAQDLIVGAPSSDGTSRSVLFGLTAAELASGATSLDASKATFTVLGLDGRDRFGSLVRAGDFDGDRVVDDFIVTAPMGVDSTSGFATGLLYLFERR